MTKSKKHPQQSAEEPCQFTIEEMDNLLDRAEADIKAGNTINASEMRERVLNRVLEQEMEVEQVMEDIRAGNTLTSQQMHETFKRYRL